MPPTFLFRLSCPIRTPESCTPQHPRALPRPHILYHTRRHIHPHPYSYMPPSLHSWLEVAECSVSLHALNILIRRCRELREVSFCVDARVDALGDNEHADDKDEVGLQPNTCLIKLEVGGSPVAYVVPLCSSPELTVSIPRFLHAMAPRLKSVTNGAWSHGTRKNP